ncbi:MAG TPA: TIM barrel protein [Tepidisphaeraceae bacterium]|nr:TIM barrel protein [Tepidisphaeraceae bacterium]
MHSHPRSPELTRRHVMLAAATAASSVFFGCNASTLAEEDFQRVIKNARINQGICMGAVRGYKLDQVAPILAKLGVKGVDLQGPANWAILKKHGLVGTMSPSHSLTQGLNRKENHEKCLAAIRKSIEDTADAGFPNVICFSGNRNGLSDEEGIVNCVAGLKQVIGLAEKRKVTLCIELLNSKVNHKDYQCDHTAWGAAVCKGVGSDRMKLLYDIYHMQVQEGDVIATIRQFKDYIGHYHTAGVPGRHQIDDTQELYYPPIMQAILATGYQGFVSHEYTPTKDPFPCLIQALQTCDV